jgi:Plasmid pRiA4b ORF-3-like protein
MPTSHSAEKPQEIYQIKVTLLDTDPPIWRRLLVPADLTLEQLHYVLQLAMGWEDCHMHEFRIGQQRFGTPDPMETAFGGSRTASERTARLWNVLGRAGIKAVYTYDFGDSWDHRIVVEKRLPPEPGRAYPACLAGERHAPPEDCGGIPGFYNLLEAIRDPEHEEHEELLDWVGEGFDPDAFSVEEVNRRFGPLQRRRSKAAARKK